MSTFAQYLAVLMLNEAEKLEDETYSGSFKGLSSRLTKLLSGVSIKESEVTEALSLLDEFAAAKHPDPLTGGYWQVDYDNFRYYFVQDDPQWNEPDEESYVVIRDRVRANFPILVTYAQNGRQFAADIVQHLAGVPGSDWEHLRSDGSTPTVPASDRIVTLNHNQQSQLDDTASGLISLVEKENGFEGDPIKRALILGQLKAGRELIRAQTFRAYLLYDTVLRALGYLIDKYGGAAIGVAAAKLLELLVEQVFKS